MVKEREEGFNFLFFQIRPCLGMFVLHYLDPAMSHKAVSRDELGCDGLRRLAKPQLNQLYACVD
jgi:hypothetical protein